VRKKGKIKGGKIVKTYTNESVFGASEYPELLISFLFFFFFFRRRGVGKNEKKKNPTDEKKRDEKS
jgi:hypothetical protein